MSKGNRENAILRSKAGHFLKRLLVNKIKAEAQGSMEKTASYISGGKHLGDFVLTPYRFPDLNQALEELRSPEYKKLSERQKSDRANSLLLELIQRAPACSFLLIALLEYIDFIIREKLVEQYSFSTFELWLNQFSGLSQEENLAIRAKIVGKRIPREEYQIYFPIGMGNTYPGSHFVTAHSSPDLDTMVSSFWGWIDAFGARVSEGLHIWNIPGGAPLSSIEVALLFHQIFGQNIFNHLVKTRTTLAMSSLDLLTQKGMIKQKTDQSSLLIDHERIEKAIVLIDESGYYLGDWRNFDIEGVRQVTMLLNNCLRWFENHLHVKLISLFAQKSLSGHDLPKFISAIFGIRIGACQPAKEFNEKQKIHVEAFLQKVLKVPRGLSSTFEEFAQAMKELGLFDFQDCIAMIAALEESKLFDVSGLLLENRPKIFNALEKIIMALDRAIQSVSTYTERLEVALSIKIQVFGYLPQVVSYRADVDEIRGKMGGYNYLTVTITDAQGRMTPLGVVRASELHKPVLGTVSLRDFCNREEIKIPSYLEVISVIDHHKSTLTTSSAPVVHICDAQSSNALVAELAFSLNDRYGTRGQMLAGVEAQIQKLQGNFYSLGSAQLLGRLLQRYHNIQAMKNSSYFIDPLREFVEYLHFLYAILDDTDLLSKVTSRDVECVAQLVNRLKSLLVGEEVEVISLQHLKKDETFVEKAALIILQNPDMYSLYRKIYLAKERLVEENFELCARGESSSIFADTKIQNGCCRVGQTKMFANNFIAFEQYGQRIRELWSEQARDFYEKGKECDLHMQMISTIPGAEDLFSGTGGEYTHKDELWLWIPSVEQAIEHLKSFLSSFRLSPQVQQNEFTVSFLGDNAHELSQIFNESFLPIPHEFPKLPPDQALPIAILRFKAGSINSRKAMISPYLPSLMV